MHIMYVEMHIGHHKKPKGAKSMITHIFNLSTGARGKKQEDREFKACINI